jgi:Matrixin
MSKNGRHVRASRGACALAAAAAAAVGSYATGAAAFELKLAVDGHALHWEQSRVDYVVDPSVEAAVGGGSAAVAGAVRGWSAAAGGPTLTIAAGQGAAKPGVDGQNSILFAPKGFAPAGTALAVTVTSYEETTGRIVDADIVINGIYRFAVLASGERPESGTGTVSTDGTSSTEGDGERTAPFDVAHVVSHELGHSLGLGDERVDRTALMYAFTTPGDATTRAPSADDVSGIDAIYGAAPDPGSTSSGSSPSGCGQASIAGSRSSAGGGAGTAGWMAVAVMWFAAKRRAAVRRPAAPAGQRHRPRHRTARAAASIAAAAAALLSGALPARSAEMTVAATPVLMGDAVARVVEVSTVNVGGLFESTVELAPTVCRDPSACPPHARAHVWGGALGGIRQVIGEEPVPAVGQTVGVSFLAAGDETLLDRDVGAPAPIAVKLVKVRR